MEWEEGNKGSSKMKVYKMENSSFYVFLLNFFDFIIVLILMRKIGLRTDFSRFNQFQLRQCSIDGQLKHKNSEQN